MLSKIGAIALVSTSIEFIFELIILYVISPWEGTARTVHNVDFVFQ